MCLPNGWRYKLATAVVLGIRHACERAAEHDAGERHNVATLASVLLTAVRQQWCARGSTTHRVL